MTEKQSKQEQELNLNGGPKEQAGKPEPPKEKKKLSRRAVVLIVLGSIAAVLLILLAVYRSWASRPELPDSPARPTGEVSASQPVQTDAPGDGGDDEDLSLLNGDRPNVTGDRKKDFFTFLLIGRDTAGAGNTDTIMLAAYDVPSQQAALMSIPRDTMVNASWDVKKINTVYNVNEASQPGSGPDAVKRYVAGLTGFEADFTVIVEWEAVGEIVEAIGGVYFDVPFFMHYSDATQDLSIFQQPGYRLLTGDDAMQIVRWRKNNEGVKNPPGTDGSDLGRTRLQQDFMAAVIRQCLQIKNVTRINQLADIFAQRVETELTAGNLVWFAEQALLGGFSTDDLYTCTMPTAGAYDVYCRTQHGTQSFVTPKANELIQIVNEHFNPYETEVGLANLDIMSVNADGTIASSTGTVRDKKANDAIRAWLDPPSDPPPEETGETPPPAETGDPPPAETGGPPGPVETEDPPEPPAETGTEPPPSETEGPIPEE